MVHQATETSGAAMGSRDPTLTLDIWCGIQVVRLDQKWAVIKFLCVENWEATEDYHEFFEINKIFSAGRKTNS